ncbi:MAG: Flp pilus assembly protein CpaB [Vulcanimicrobiaceae bacterium]
MNTRRTTLLVAIILAIGTGWLTLNYISSVQHASVAGTQLKPTLVAVQQIPPRVRITAAMVKRALRPEAAIEPDALSQPQQAVGSLSLIAIPAGSTITASKIGSPIDVGLPVQITPGMRAVSIGVNPVEDVAGLIQPGDRVDVIAIPPRQGQAPPPASAILRGVRVLAVGQSIEYNSATPPPAGQNSSTVTLEVTPRQADLLAMADLNTTLRLALRSPKEPINSEPVEALHFPSPMQPAAVAASGGLTAAPMGSAPAAAAAPASASAASPVRYQSGVEIIVGSGAGP